MDDGKIEELRAEIARRGPELTIVAVGRLFGDAVDAIVQDRWGQSMWSVYRKFTGSGSQWWRRAGQEAGPAGTIEPVLGSEAKQGAVGGECEAKARPPPPPLGWRLFEESWKKNRNIRSWNGRP